MNYHTIQHQAQTTQRIKAECAINLEIVNQFYISIKFNN